MTSTTLSSLPCACRREAMTSCKRRRIWRADAAADIIQAPTAQRGNCTLGNGPSAQQHDERGENTPDRQSDQIAASSSLIRSFRFLSSWIITSFGAGRFNSALILASIPACLDRSEEHTSELQSLMRISYAVFCLKQQTN